MVISGSKKPRWRRPKCKLEASEQQNTNRWVTSTCYVHYSYSLRWYRRPAPSFICLPSAQIEAHIVVGSLLLVDAVTCQKGACYKWWVSHRVYLFTRQNQTQEIWTHSSCERRAPDSRSLGPRDNESLHVPHRGTICGASRLSVVLLGLFKRPCVILRENQWDDSVDGGTSQKGMNDHRNSRIRSIN